jgi:murein DD-endopeptidase MepM/ murein hydrolase activator NlpD
VNGDPPRVENHLAYDQPVFAVADGTVVGVLDGLDDQVPGALPDPASITIDNIDGNYVVLDIGRGLYVFYAHLKKGTVRVKRGDRVATGRELGRVGNTGNTSAPHLHLHVMNAPSALGGDGLPFVFARSPSPACSTRNSGTRPDSHAGDTYRTLPGDGTGSRRDELPLDLRIVGFPAATK